MKVMRAVLQLSLFAVAYCSINYDEQYAKFYLQYVSLRSAASMHGLSLARWNYESNMTAENQQIELSLAAVYARETRLASEEHSKFDVTKFKNPDVKRQFKLLSGLGSSALSPEKYDIYEQIKSKMGGIYAKAKVCDYKVRTKCNLSLDPEITERLKNSRDAKELKYYWKAWHDASGKKIGPLYPKYVKLSNEAAVRNNYTDNAANWISQYETDDFPKMIEHLWQQMRPLYLQMHAYVRRKLREVYGEEVVSKKGPIPAHLLGNMWAQNWENILDLTIPFPSKQKEDLTQKLIDQGYTPVKMFELAEKFFISLNLSKMTDKFWENSIIEKPTDGRNLICHASAWDLHGTDDFRIKMCTVVSMESLKVIHHEMGHIEYYMYYKDLPTVYQGGANPGFHEAIGDTITLSVMTPNHLRKIGLLDTVKDDDETDINSLFSTALSKIAFMPFGYLVDLFRWSIFRGETPPKQYNCEWWKLREKYQGIEPPMDRSDDDFDAGAKFHVAIDDEYIDYFVALVLQFQFHRSLCQAAGQYNPKDPNTQPLYKCSIYNSKKAGNLLKSILSLGSSKPWPEVLKKITGKPYMDASAIVDYFSTLKTWLEAENKRTGEYIGWKPTKRAGCSKKSE